LTQANSVTAKVDVAVDPNTAFKIFTDEIDSWWDRGPTNFYDGARAIEKRFESGVGGRYLEVYDDATSDALEIGRITVWEPGKRLVFRHSLNDTEVDVRFEAIPTGTRVVLEQRLVPGGTKAEFNSGWHNILGWFADWADRPAAARTPLMDYPRISPVLYYRDSAAAAEWLVRVFGLRRRHRDLGELMLGDSVVIVRGFEAADHAAPATAHALYAYVDDIQEHFARSQAGGAVITGGIRKHGDRFYDAEDIGGHRWTFAQARPGQRSMRRNTAA
jgi:uncharacterized glyoxalase superfamily protein PhnB